MPSKICKDYREYFIKLLCIKRHITSLEHWVSCKLSPVYSLYSGWLMWQGSWISLCFFLFWRFAVVHLLTLWIPEGFDKTILPDFLIFYFRPKVGSIILAFSVLEIIFGSLMTIWQSRQRFKKTILDLIGRGCIYFNVSGSLGC